MSTESSLPPPHRRVRSLLRRALPPARLSEVERVEIERSLFRDAPNQFGPYVYRVTTLTTLSALIASLGLIKSSSAVVIGAMLVSPLMQPIIGLSAAIVGSAWRRQLVSIGLIVLTSLQSVGLAALVAWIVPAFQAVTITPEILSRTSPGVLDLGIACAAGAAGAYVTVRHQAAAALPGAAIAVALAPPLAALGILLERGNGALATGAFLLFATNLFGIILAAALVLSAGRLTVQRHLRWHGRVALLVPLAIAIGIAYPLVRHSAAAYRQNKDELLVRSALIPPLRDQGFGIQDLSVVEQSGELVVSVDVAGPEPVSGTSELSQAVADRTHRQVSLIFRWTKRTETTASAGPQAG